jgi:hypothetical protein
LLIKLLSLPVPTPVQSAVLTAGSITKADAVVAVAKAAAAAKVLRPSFLIDFFN